VTRLAIENVGLVLEGGGMRGLYTCGVLDYFLERQLYFPYVIGVSAGACNAVSYIAKQKERNLSVNTEFVRDWRYMSLRNLMLEKSYFGMDFIFKEIPQKYIPFDYEAFHSASSTFVAGATDCETGEPFYLDTSDFDPTFTMLRASSSLPLISKMVEMKGKRLLDGGISDPIPIMKAQRDGYKKNVVILTRDKHYRKEPMRHKGLFKLKYHAYPALVSSLLNRHVRYNQTLDKLEEMKMRGEVFVIQSSLPLEVDRLEKDKNKLKSLYEKGYHDAAHQYEALMAFLT